MPSNHVCSNFESPEFPQFLNQTPPKAQQLSMPDFFMVPHFAHTGLGVIVLGGVVAAGIDMWTIIHFKLFY